jgi:hypothetical protein
MNKANIFFTSLITSLLHAAIAAPNTNIQIQNSTHCKLTLLFEQTQTAKLSIPDMILSQSVENGHITFSDSMFATGQQEAIGQYQVTCNDTNHILALNFYAGTGHLSDHGYYFTATTNTDSPFIIIPFGRTIIKDGQPFLITLLNKEEKHEKIDDNISTDILDVTGETDGNPALSEQNNLSDNPTHPPK